MGKEKLKYWFYWLFFNKTIRTHRLKNYIFKWKERYLEIKSKSENVSVRIGSGMHPYFYLLESSRQGLEENLEGYAFLVFSTSLLLTKDDEFVSFVTAGLMKFTDNTIAKGAEMASNVDETTEQLEQAYMEDVVKRGQMTRQQRRKAEREAVKEMKKVLKSK